MAAFTVYFLRGDTSGHDFYDERHTMVFRDWGLLEVMRNDEQVRVYSPSYWTKVEPGGRQPGIY